MLKYIKKKNKSALRKNKLNLDEDKFSISNLIFEIIHFSQQEQIELGK